MNHPSTEDLLPLAKGFVRGELDWRVLESSGIRVMTESGGSEIHVPPGYPHLPVSSKDIATGFLRHWAIGSDLRQWASLLLAMSFIDFSDIEELSEGNALLEALWSASAEEPISDETIAVIRRIADP